MINYKELYEILGFNNINNLSSEETVIEALGHLNYSEDDKKQAILFLKSQGWMGGSAELAVETPVQAAGIESTVDTSVQLEDGMVPPVQPAAEPMQDSYRAIDENLLPAKKKTNLVPILIGLILFVLLAGGGIMFAYMQKIGPFSEARYTEANFLSGLLEKSGQIKSAAYIFSLDMNVSARDADAQPFVLDETSNAALLRKQYENDSTRVGDVSGIIRRLNELADYDSYDYGYGAANDKAVVKPVYPESIVDIFSGIDEKKSNYNYYYYEDASVKDPATGKIYDYRVTDSGSNFELTVNFETNEAVKAVERYGNGYNYGQENDDAEKVKATTLSGKKATFTRDSSEYIYMTGEPPKPFFEVLSDSLRMISPETKISGSVSAASEFSEEILPDWKFNANAEGDFGDLSYRTNIDALKKGDDYYVKINNFPSLFFFDITPFKGKWLRISPEELAKWDDGYSMFSSWKENIAKTEKEFRENRRKSVKFTKKVVEIANEEKLISFRDKPRKEKVGDRQLIKYDLKINKSSILTFCSRVQEVIGNDPDFDEYRNLIDQGLIDYLGSDEFDLVFDYFENNNQLVLWTDTEGFPAVFKNNLRVVPPDTAIQLEDKQINIVLGWTLDGINEEIAIEVPQVSVPIDKAIEDYEKNFDISEVQSAPVIAEDSRLMKLIGSLRASIGYSWK